ncbi:MAG TPA: trehalose-phosphatase [Deltaproteobacteria bacterium]|nr:trehalose-phosphatase [Deltaproteobacteria bacterium]HQB38887.1 trehalose-phosphatase [Deltaproteobacteria bacterium]
MRYLFSPAALSELHRFIAGSTLFAFDLDGTLTPIVSDPGGIMIHAEVNHCLTELDRLAPVAIITGRSSADARGHLGFTPRFLVGNHGAEGLPGVRGDCGNHVALVQGWIDQLHQLVPGMREMGIVIEDKGASVTLHYRHAADPEKADGLLLEAISSLNPIPRRVGGKFVENLVPQGAHNKGSALLSLMSHLSCRRAIFVGDDVTDEDVFRLDNPDVLGICVEKRAGSAARYYLKGQYEVIRLLREIVNQL